MGLPGMGSEATSGGVGGRFWARGGRRFGRMTGNGVESTRGGRSVRRRYDGAGDGLRGVTAHAVGRI